MDPRRRRMLLQGLATACGAAAVAYFVLWACAPVIVARPPVPGGAAPQTEVGLAGYGEVLGPQNSTTDPTKTGAGVAMWGLRRWGNLELGVQGYAGTLNALGGGGFVRYAADVGGGLRLGLDAELGWLYGAIGVPVAYRLGSSAWLWTRPAVTGTISDQLVGFHAPLGLAVLPTDGLVLNLEVDGLFGGLASDPNGNGSASHPFGLAGGLSAGLRF